MLERKESIVEIFSCITALNSVKHDTSCPNSGDDEVQQGLSFWIVFDWPEHPLSSFENMITKELFNSGMDMKSYTAVQGRGIKFSINTSNLQRQ